MSNTIVREIECLFQEVSQSIMARLLLSVALPLALFTSCKEPTVDLDMAVMADSVQLEIVYDGYCRLNFPNIHHCMDIYYSGNSVTLLDYTDSTMGPKGGTFIIKMKDSSKYPMRIMVGRYNYEYTIDSTGKVVEIVGGPTDSLHGFRFPR